jgi:hypothetical protein
MRVLCGAILQADAGPRVVSRSEKRYLTQRLVLVALGAMRLNAYAFLLLMVAVTGFTGLTGCVGTLDGRSRLGLPTKDRITARYERAPMEIWHAAKDVLAYNGTLYSEDTLKSTLEGSVNNRTVWVRIIPLNTKVSEVTIQTRTKAGGSDLELAGEIDKQIAIRLASGRLSPTPPPTSR